MNQKETAPKGGNQFDLAKPLYQNHQVSKKLPPYGRRAIDRLAAGKRPCNTVFIAVGSTAWDFAKARPKLSVIAVDQAADPAAFNWSFLTGFGVVIYPAGEHPKGLLTAVAAECLLAGADPVLQQSPNGLVKLADAEVSHD